jgi:hypothetical protein
LAADGRKSKSRQTSRTIRPSIRGSSSAKPDIIALSHITLMVRGTPCENS